jgi:hypothetical protein
VAHVWDYKKGKKKKNNKEGEQRKEKKKQERDNKNTKNKPTEKQKDNDKNSKYFLHCWGGGLLHFLPTQSSFFLFFFLSLDRIGQ